MALEGNKVMIIAILSISLLGTLAMSRVIYGGAGQTFEQWMIQHGRIYPNDQERGRRFAIFQTNLQYIENFNKLGNKTYTLGLNQFSDMTNEEFLRHHTGYRKFPTTSSPKPFRYQNLSDNDVPNMIDWRKQEAVTPVKNQADCGCCWAFSAVAAMEGITKIRTGQLISLSEQQLVDCDRDMFNDGCQGGNMVDAFEYILRHQGLAKEDKYQYTARDETCDHKKENEAAASITGHEHVPPKEGDLLKAVSRQPVSVGISVEGQDFQHYRSGVFSGDCGLTLGHAVTVVGYGQTREGTKFWLIKNSWGDDWAERGYFRIIRGNGRPQGQCGIAMDGSYPTA